MVFEIASKLPVRRVRSSGGIGKTFCFWHLRMTTFSRQRKFRLRSFESRAAYARDVRTYRAWRYVTVHPFADEPELLARLSMSPDDCRSADVWWHTGTDVVLLQTSAGGDPPFAIKMRWFGQPPILSIVAELPHPTTTIARLHELMDRIAAHGLPRRCRDRGIRMVLPS